MNETREQRRFVAEKEERRIKPPPRSFSPLKAEARTALSNDPQAVRIPLVSAEEGPEAARNWLLRAAPLAGGILHIRLTQLPAGRDKAAPLPPSWAVPDRPAEAPSGTEQEELPQWSLDGDAALRFGRLLFDGWSCHPEALRCVLKAGAGANIYGLGERMGRLERSGRVWDLWNTDEPDHLPSRDPLYVNIPFTIICSGDSWYGFFLDVPGRQYWDTATSAAGEIRIDTEDDYLEAYLFAGSSPAEVYDRYIKLTGRMPLPPRWALGFHQSRYSYYPASQVEKLAARFRREELPLDTIHLDIDYMSGYRIFTWNKKRFPDPAKLVQQLAEDGIRLITIVDPGIKEDPSYPVYAEGLENERFCRLPDGTVYKGRVWPGTAVYPDFSREKVRRWWAEQHEVLLNAGVSGIWNDMNEPADFTGDPDHRPDYTVPNELIAENDGSPVSFRHFHNLYANAMNLATREAFRLLRPKERGFVLTRSGYAGVQRSSAVWTGDNCSWWEHLAAAVPMLLGLSVSGVPFVGSDTGGFQEDASPELYARWIAFSAFTPLFRAHTADDTAAHEPWSFGSKVLAIARHYLRLRYSLLPYIYTAFEASHRTGRPLMTPLFMEWPTDLRLRSTGDAYLFGPSILAAPVTAPDSLHRHLYLPPGGWFDLWEDRYFSGSEDILCPAPLEQLPLFVRAGSVVPREEPRLSTAAPRQETLTLEVYPDSEGRAEGELYEDAGEGHDYADGHCLRLRFVYEREQLRVEPLHKAYPAPWKNLRIRVHQPLTGSYTYRPNGREAAASGPVNLPAAFNEGAANIREFKKSLEQ